MQHFRTQIISYPHCPYCLTESCEIWYTRTPQNNVKQLSVSWTPAVQGTLYVEPTAPVTVHFSSDFDRNFDTRHVQKILISNCVYYENQRSEIYIAYRMVWMNWCCCFTHLVQDLCEIQRENSAQNGADYLWVSCIPTHGTQYICSGATLCVYRKIGTFQMLS
jgi:hypothetical protein